MTADGGLYRKISFGLAIGLAIAAPLPFGAVTPGWRAALALALAFGLGLLWREGENLPRPPRRFAALAAATLALVALYLVPLPAGAVAALSPRLAAEARASLAFPGEDADLAAAERRVAELAGGTRDERTARPLAVDTDGALEGGTRLLIALGAFLLGLFAASGDRLARRRIAAAVAVSAFVQAAYGLAETLSGSHSIFGWHNPYYAKLVTGTFVCPNHTADVLILGLFATLGLLLVRRSHGDDAEFENTARDDRAARSARRAVAVTAIGVVLIALLWTSSRAGLAAGAGGLLLLGALLVFRRDETASHPLTILVAGTAVVALVAGAIVIRPVQPLVEDLERAVPGYEDRAQLHGVAIELARAFPIVGTGPGTFDAAHRILRPRAIGVRVEHAHSDWLQWWAETGVPGLALLFGWLFCVATGAVGVFRRHRDRVLTAALAAALGALAVHAAVEFSLQLPGVTVPAALVAGVLLAPLRWRPAGDREVSRGHTWPLVLAASALALAAAGTATLVAARDLPPGSGDDPPRALTPGQERQWARTEMAELLAGARRGALPADAAARAGRAYLAAQSAARRAPLRSEYRLTLWEALQAVLSARGAGAPVPEGAGDLAAAYLERSLALDPANRRLRLTTARYWTAAGDAARASRDVRDLLGMSPGYAAEAYEVLGGASLDLPALMEATPNTPASARALAGYLEQRKDAVGAQIVLERALGRSPGDPLLSRALAGNYIARRRFDDALAVLDALGARGGTLAPADRRAALVQRATIYGVTGRSEAFDVVMRELESLGEEPRVIALIRSRERSAAGDHAAAIVALERALDHPARALTAAQRLELLVALGREQDRAGRVKDALETFRRARQIAPGNAEVKAFFSRLDPGGEAAGTP